ncbi:MAG: M60 family metallopeptidase [Bacteroidales bacterium]|nr:M60 family metallopeptidase [Bacteroidales bacterium]
MKQIHKIFLAALALATPLVGHAQYIQLDADDQKGEYILTPKDTVSLSFKEDMTTVAVASNCNFTAATDADWLTLVQEGNGNLSLFSGYYYGTTPRYGTVTLTSASGGFSRTLVVEQEASDVTDELLNGDTKLDIISATATSTEPDNGIELSFDGSTSTFYHSAWSADSTIFPVTLTYTLAEFPHVDYVVYTPRQDNTTNGNFDEFTVEYTVKGDTSTWIKLGDYDLNGVKTASTINFGDEGVDEVYQVRFTVNSGSNDFVSCAEMTFYEATFSALIDKYFVDDLLSGLKEGVTEEELPSISNNFVRQLVYQMLHGEYSTKYRVGEFQAYYSPFMLREELKTQYYYSFYENPTGIYFTKGEQAVLLVEGIPSDVTVSLVVKSFGETQSGESGHPTKTYTLKNGTNVLTMANRGNGYIYYYVADASVDQRPNVRIHFVNATENGYFSLERGDDNEYWKELLANAKSDILDVQSTRLHVACPVDLLKANTPNNGVELAQLYDSIVYREHQIMGLDYYGRVPKNHMFARPVDSGMYADTNGAAAAFSYFSQWVSYNGLELWGFAHELGHVNQTYPGFKWVGCGETTNNVYSVWVQHKLGSGYHRLEDEVSGYDNYASLRGGRFEAYLEEGVRKGASWQLQPGPSNHGTSSSVTVTAEDYTGKQTGSKVTTTLYDYDVFVKLVPLWQLVLYSYEANKAPDAYGKVLEGIRNYANESNLSDGQLQIKFMRSFCDSTQIDFTDFFEKAGMLKPVSAYISDYTNGWLMISEDMVTELKEYIAEKNYPKADAAINYINAYNYETFRDNQPLTQATVGEGCTALSSGRIQVDGDVWQNAVGYETYDAEGNLLYISMYGLGADQQSSRYTQVLWDDSSAYIMAVGYDGTRYKCYEP